jgi:site-specific recombinase XerD
VNKDSLLAMKQFIPTIDHSHVDTNAAVPSDPWNGISEDVIRRFFDVLCIEQGVPKGMLPAYRADLDAFDRWLIGAKHKTLMSATGEDVREYFDASMSCIKAFYGFLVKVGCRDDDPTKPARKPRRRRAAAQARPAS